MNGDKVHMTYFLDDVAKYMIEKNHGDFRNTIIIFPNQRARLFFNAHLAAHTDKPLWAPDYYSISDFIQLISGLQVADQLTLIFRLFHVYIDISGSKEPFDTFYYYCEMMLSDFDDIDKYSIDAGVLFKNISDIREIEDHHEYLDELQLETISQFWNIYRKTKDSPEKESFIAIWNLLFAVYKKFRDELTVLGLAYEGMAYRRAVENLKNEKIESLEGRQILFVGFNALNRCEEIIFEKFRRRGNTLFFWDYDESYIVNELHEAGLFLRKYISRFPAPEDFVSGHSDPVNQKISIISVPSDIAQTKIIDFCIDEMKIPYISNPSQTALILADENLLLPVINSLPQEIDEVNITMGYPILETPAYNFILALADLHRNKKSKEGKDGGQVFYHTDLFRLLKHSFLQEIWSLENSKLFESKCKESNLIYIDPSCIVGQHPLLEMIFTSFTASSSFVNYLCNIIDLVGVQMHADTTRTPGQAWQAEVLYSIHKTLMQFDKQLNDSGLTLQFPTIINLLHVILSRVTVPFTGEPLRGLQIMGILETRALDFENLIILSMNEGKFPKTGHAPSFVPFALREGFGLPTIRHQDAIYAYYFYRLLHRAKKIALVYNTRSEGMQKGEPSRYILQLDYESEKPVERVNLGYRILPLSHPTFSGSRTKQVTNSLQKFLHPDGKSFLSPSALNTYLKCKLQFYYKYIEGLKEPQDIEEEVESNVFGSILHKAMSFLYLPFAGKEVTLTDMETLRGNDALIEDALYRAFGAEYFFRAQVVKGDFRGKNLIIKNILHNYVNGIIEFDYRNVPFKMISLEAYYQEKIQLIGSDSVVNIGGFVDRIDIKNGRTRIIDYKTGRKNNTFQSIPELFDTQNKSRNEAVFQTFLYAYMVSGTTSFTNIQPALLYIRDIAKPDFSISILQSENRKKSIVEDFSPFLSEFEECLINLLTEIFNSSIPFAQTAIDEHCKSCPYNKICMK
jgi:hypothetical protein